MPWSLPFSKVNLGHYFYEQVRKSVFSLISMFASDAGDDTFSQGNTYANFNCTNSLLIIKRKNT